MKLNLKLSLKNIIRYIYIIIILVNLVIIYQVFLFANKYLYKTFIMDKHILENAAAVKSDDLNIEKFENVISEIENKSKRAPQQEGASPFD